MRLFWMIKMAYKFINNYETKLTAQTTAAETSITVANAAGLSLSAGEVYRMTIQNADASLYELVDVTSISGNTLTVQRAKEATTAQVWPIDSTVLCSVTAEQIAKINKTDSELWYPATSAAFNIANGSKQTYTMIANANMTVDLNSGDDITIIINPADFLLVVPAVITWFNSAPVFTPNKLHTLVISRNGSLYYGYWQVAS